MSDKLQFVVERLPFSLCQKLQPRMKLAGQLRCLRRICIEPFWYYSFARLTHEYGYGSDIELQQNRFSVGFAGADFGFLTRLGKVAIEEVTLDHPAAQFLSTFTAPTAEPGARDQQKRAAAGFDVNGFTYKDSVPFKRKNSYLLRSIGYRVSDLLVGFRIVTQDDDGSVVIVWKILKKFPMPQLVVTQSRPGKL